MRHASVLGVLIYAGVAALAVPASRAAAQAPPAASWYPPTASAPATQPVPANEPPVKDLTPSGFADITPPPGSSPVEFESDFPQLGPLASNQAGFYATAEYLLLRPRSDEFDFAIVNNPSSLATTGPIEPLKAALGNGFRVEGGYRFNSGWETGFVYTLLNAGGNRTLSAGDGGVLYPTVTRPGLTDTALFAGAHTQLNYNVYDVIFGRRWAIDDCVAVRAFGGVRFADIGRRFDVGFDGLDANLAAVRSRSGFDGFGPIIGGEAVLGGCHGFHLYTRALGGLISGRSTNSLVETNNSDATVYVNTRYDLRKVVPMASLAIGGGWQYRTISIRGGYEITHWSGIGQPIRFVDDVSQGKIDTRPSDLSLEGFFFQFGIAF
ncbi:MAG TPA: Lpg1974 family pore-forming outer membrane protein [Gemmata sp.]|nr:Lpg1974 family pore-forming outer membrane protein [Gemmata sp.]